MRPTTLGKMVVSKVKEGGILGWGGVMQCMGRERGGGGPGVDGGSTVSLPGIVVSNVVDQHVLVWLGAQDVPIIGVVQEGVAMILQFGRRSRHLKSDLKLQAHTP